MSNPHQLSIPAELLINDTRVSVSVRIQEERSVIDGRRNMHGTLWIMECTAGLFRARYEYEPLVLVMPDGSKTDIIIVDGDIELGTSARLSFGPAEHFKLDEE